MKFNYYGHSAFTLSDDVTTILFDPFITENPWTQVCPTDIHCQYIIVTHCHGDHYGDTEAIAKANDATVISTAEVAGKAGEAGCKAHAMHVGGSADFPFGKVRLTPAFHGSGIAGGLACGVIVEFGGKRVYFAGDTGLFSDMKILDRFGPIDCAILPIGDNFTMGIATQPWQPFGSSRASSSPSTTRPGPLSKQTLRNTRSSRKRNTISPSRSSTRGQRMNSDHDPS